MSEKLLTTAQVVQEKILLQKCLTRENNPIIFYPSSALAGSSTSRIVSGTIQLGEEPIRCVLKIPTPEVAGQFFYNLVYGSPMGVQIALRAAMDEVARPQQYSPEVAPVGVTQKLDGTFCLTQTSNSDNQVGLLMLEVPISQWLDQIIERSLFQADWKSQLIGLLQKALGVVAHLQTDADPNNLTANHPDQIIQWPSQNGFERIMALCKGVDTWRLLCSNLDSSGEVLRQFLESAKDAIMLGSTEHVRAQTILHAFQELARSNSLLLAQRLANGRIVSGHGDAKIGNIAVLLDENGEQQPVALDGLRFYDAATQACRPWHERDARWSGAQLVTSAATMVARSKGPTETIAFMAELEKQAISDCADIHSEQVAHRLYSLYAFLVEADTVLRMAFSSMQAQLHYQAILYFQEVKGILELGAVYAEQVTATSAVGND